ncbi:MAG: AAA family ATPase [Nocardioidaceae bacterium]
MVRRGWVSYGPGAESDGGAPSDAAGDLRLSDFRKLGRRLVRGVVAAARVEDQVTFASMLRDHLGMDTDDVEVVSESWPSYDLVNVQAGLDAWLAQAGRDHRLVGVANFRHNEFGLVELLRQRGSRHPMMPAPGNVARVPLPSGPDGQVRACVQCGLYLVEDGVRRIAFLLRAAAPEMGQDRVMLQCVADAPGLAAEVSRTIRESALEHNVYRGQVVAFGHDMFGERDAMLSFRSRPRVTAADLILPAETLAAIDQQVVGVGRHKDRLRAAGQHLKRGVLLYGPPGVGKTHTVRYLVSKLVGTSVIELSGQALGLVEQACSIARSLQPALIVVEDVDLIAEERGMHPGQHPLLFTLLEQMDGLAEDADVVFLLTTNRADLLEPALASRPGRVDQAVEIHLPGDESRRRLFALYRGDLEVDESHLDTVVERTEGVTASFVKELLRRAAVRAASDDADDESTPIRVSADQLDAALAELLDARNAMTRTLLGGVAGDD